MIEIRPVTTIEECRHITTITCAAWQTDHADAIPDHATLIVAKERGGVVLLAWDGDIPVGFCWGFLAFSADGKLKHASHQAAVMPAYQSKGVGELLKWAQREAVLALDINHMTWTFDPLWTLNGWLNMRKLGAICHTYQRNVYGEVNDGLNMGLATDRLYVDWWLDSERVHARADQSVEQMSLAGWREKGAVLLNPASKPNDPNVLATLRMGAEMPALFIAVPKHYPSLVQSDIEMAKAWRMFTRDLFEWTFARGYQVVDLVCKGELCYYVLSKV